MKKEDTQQIPASLLNANKAIALSYDGKEAPTLAAKGDDELAQAIIQLALQTGILLFLALLDIQINR